MNSAFKRYGKIKYKHTRYGRERLAFIKAIRHAIIASIAAQGSSMCSQIASTPGDKHKKLAAMADCVSRTRNAIKSVYDKFPTPAWAK